jgi:hypothetical protein
MKASELKRLVRMFCNINSRSDGIQALVYDDQGMVTDVGEFMKKDWESDRMGRAIGLANWIVEHSHQDCVKLVAIDYDASGSASYTAALRLETFAVDIA